MSRGERRANEVEVTAEMRRVGRDAFLRDGAAGGLTGEAARGLEDALERVYRAMEGCRRDALEARLRHRLHAPHG